MGKARTRLRGGASGETFPHKQMTSAQNLVSANSRRELDALRYAIAITRWY
jgi:hypothetical protein